MTEETVDRVRESFSRSPRKSIMLINTWQELEYRYISVELQQMPTLNRSPRKLVMLINTWQELDYRLDICRATTGAHIEVYGRA